MSKRRVTQNYMDTVFVPSEEITFTENEQGYVVVAVTNKGPFNWLAQKCFGAPRVSYISLDQLGTALWKNLDGKNTVFDLVNVMKKTFPDQDDRMLDRVVTFLHILKNKNYIKVN